MSKKPYTDDFNLFWKLWPGRFRPEENRYVKVGKREAWDEWEKLDEEDQAEILTVAKSGRIKSRGTQYLPDAVRWLKRKRWDDY